MKYFICVITLFLCLACVENKDQLNDLSLEDANQYKVDSFITGPSGVGKTSLLNQIFQVIDFGQFC